MSRQSAPIVPGCSFGWACTPISSLLAMPLSRDWASSQGDRRGISASASKYAITGKVRHHGLSFRILPRVSRTYCYSSPLPCSPVRCTCCKSFEHTAFMRRSCIIWIFASPLTKPASPLHCKLRLVKAAWVTPVVVSLVLPSLLTADRFQNCLLNIFPGRNVLFDPSFTVTYDTCSE